MSTHGSPDLDATTLRSLLTELGARLVARGVRADLYIVGGAAIALTLDTRRLTQDVDAVFHPTVDVRDVAEEIAHERGISPRWLNNAAAAFTPNERDAEAVSLDIPGIAVSTASAEHLFAMKLAASRDARDRADLRTLLRTLGITSAADGVALARRLYGEESVVLSDPDESYLWLLEDELDSMADDREA